MPKLSIIIPSYNTKKVTDQCLMSLLSNLRAESAFDYEIIVVDNASTDGSQDAIKKYESRFKSLKLIKNRKNIGFSKANNHALKIAVGEYILFLNSDVVVNSVNFKRLLYYLDSRPDVGVCTVRVNLNDGTIDPASHRGFPTIWNSLCYFLKLEKIFGIVPYMNRIFGEYHLVWKDRETIHEIDSPSGAFYLSRKKILREVGGFDEDFFMYGEDLDLSWRIKELGYKVLYYPLFHVTHLKYVSGLETINNEVRQEIKKHFYDAMEIFYEKHYAKKHSGLINKIIYGLIDLKSKL